MNEIGAIKYRLEQGYTMTRYGSKDAMIEQLKTDTEYLLSKVENNEVLDLVSKCESCGSIEMYQHTKTKDKCNNCEHIQRFC